MLHEAAIRLALQLREGQQTNQNVAPSGVEEMYKRCPVVLSDGSINSVRVHKYRIDRADPANANAAKRILDSDADNEGRDARSALRSWHHRGSDVPRELRGRVRQLVREGRLTNMFSGKGAPKDISVFLTALSVCGRVLDATQGAAQMTEQARIQDYVDRFIGIDCSGFVNNYFIAAGHYSDNLRNRNTPIARYGRRDNRFHFLPFRPQQFLLVWRSMAHIGIIEDWGPGGWVSGNTVRVLESAASLGGLNNSIYDVVQFPGMTDRNPVWRVERRIQPGRTYEVYMAGPLGPS